MLESKSNPTGATLLELIVGLAIMGILLALGAPSFFNWIQNSQINTAAESIQNGLQLARVEAVRRNATARFQLTNSLASTCALSTSGGNWVVSLDDPSDACNSSPSETVAPRIIQTRAAAEGSRNAAISATQSTIVFNGLGRVTPAPASDIDIDITNPTGGACATATTTGMRCRRVRISIGGQIRMCDPLLASTDPQGC